LVDSSMVLSFLSYGTSQMSRCLENDGGSLNVIWCSLEQKVRGKEIETKQGTQRKGKTQFRKKVHHDGRIMSLGATLTGQGKPGYADIDGIGQQKVSPWRYNRKGSGGDSKGRRKFKNSEDGERHIRPSVKGPCPEQGERTGKIRNQLTAGRKEG